MLRALVLAVGWSVAFACPANGSAAERGTRNGPQGGVARLLRPPETHVDPSGNLKDDGTRLFLYDYRNRLIGVSRKPDGAPIAAYRYDALGRRVERVVYSQASPGAVEKVTRFFWDGWDLIEEQSAAGITESTYVGGVGVDEHVQWQRTASHPLGAGTFYLHQDARGSVVAVSDQGGAVVDKVRYDDFGRADHASAVGLALGFQGRYLDAETGLYEFRHRVYDPGTGRFLQRDPVWDPANFGGQYTFVGNGPVSRMDPMGLGPMDDEIRRLRASGLSALDLEREIAKVHLRYALGPLLPVAQRTEELVRALNQQKGQFPPSQSQTGYGPPAPALAETRDALKAELRALLSQGTEEAKAVARETLNRLFRAGEEIPRGFRDLVPGYEEGISIRKALVERRDALDLARRSGSAPTPRPGPAPSPSVPPGGAVAGAWGGAAVFGAGDALNRAAMKDTEVALQIEEEMAQLADEFERELDETQDFLDSLSGKALGCSSLPLRRPSPHSGLRLPNRNVRPW